jgi:hypothetical protein
MVCKEKEVDCNPSNEGRHMSFIAAVGRAEISSDASGMKGLGTASPMTFLSWEKMEIMQELLRLCEKHHIDALAYVFTSGRKGSKVGAAFDSLPTRHDQTADRNI